MQDKDNFALQSITIATLFHRSDWGFVNLYSGAEKITDKLSGGPRRCALKTKSHDLIAEKMVQFDLDDYHTDLNASYMI